MDEADKKLAAKIVGLLTSDHDGERAAAGAKLTEIAKRNKMSLAELMAAVYGRHTYTSQPPPRNDPPPRQSYSYKPKPPPTEKMAKLQKISDRQDMASRVLSSWELDFALDVAGRYDNDGELSEKQTAIVDKILRKVERVFR